MFPWGELTPPLATLVGAALTAFIALMVAIMTKEAKVSEFRQLWINALREDIAEAISAASTLSVILNPNGSVHDYISGTGAKPHPRAAMLPEWARLSAALARIDLRLNMTEGPHQQLELCIREAEQLVRQIETTGHYVPQEWIDLQDKVIAVSRPLLKIEWDVVRQGELTYRITQRALVIAVVAIPLFIMASYVCANAEKSKLTRATAVPAAAPTPTP